MEIGTVLSTSLGPNRDGTTNVRLMSVQFADLTDIRTVQLLGPIDHNPRIGAKVVVFEIETSWEVGLILEDIAAAALTAVGDKVIASDLLGAQKAFIALRGASGNIELNGTSDYAVAFNDLKTAFDAFIIEYNAHVHATAGTGTPSAPQTPSTASIDSAKVSTVLLP